MLCGFNEKKKGWYIIICWNLECRRADQYFTQKQIKSMPCIYFLIWMK